MTVIGNTANRPIEVVKTVIDPVRVRVLPDGRMSAKDAAAYVGRAEKTLAMMRMEGRGPRYIKVGGRIFYRKDDLDAFIQGHAA